jgi:hypothetical protein
MEIEMEMEIGSGLGLAGLGWAGLGWDLALWRPGGLEKAEQHSLACKRTTDSSHRIKMDTC